jgi:hypothetical protein
MKVMVCCENKTIDFKFMEKLVLKNLRFFWVVILCLVILSNNYAYAQDTKDSTKEGVEKINPAIKFSVLKNSDDTRILTAVFTYRDKETREFINVNDISLNFISGTESNHKLGTIKTDNEGVAKYIIPADFKYSRNDSGYIHFAIEFEGNEKFEASSSEVDIIDVQIKLTLEEVDSVKNVRVEANKVLGEGKIVPLEGDIIYICAERMFSHLKLGEITLENGTGSFEFPSNLPGDSLGNITVIAKFDENEIYGSVEKSENVNWGIKTYHHAIYHPRSLWTAVAPIWMIVTLSIMLLGVWGHYFYVFIQLIRLKRIKPDKIEKPEEKNEISSN